MSNITVMLYNIPSAVLFTATCLIVIVLALIGVHVVKATLPMELRLRDNLVIGYISANICMLFAVLAGFILLYMLNSYGRAQDVVRIEVSKAIAIYHHAARLDKAITNPIQAEIKNYLERVATKEWPVMQQGEHIYSPMPRDKQQQYAGLYGEEILIKIRKQLDNYQPQDYNKALAVAEIYKDLAELSDVRDERLAFNDTTLGCDIWLILIISAIITMIVNFIYGVEHYPLYIILVPLISIMIMSLLFIIFVMDQPFCGTYSMKPVGYLEAVASFV